MADRVTLIKRVTLAEVGGDVRASTVKRLTVSSESVDSGTRITTMKQLNMASEPGAQRVTVSKVLYQAAEPGPQRVTGVWRLSVQLAKHRLIVPLLDLSGEIWDPRWEIDADSQMDALVPEWNPYRPTVPNEYYDLGDVLYDFQKENQETQRAQHNLIQAGDTTFPWQKMTRVTQEKLYTVGAVGRFYHETYGIIIGRYVQFTAMDPTAPLTSPVGLSRDTTELDWKVTNRIAESHPDLVVGIIAGYQFPKNNEYGWVICSGAVLGTVYCDSEGKSHGEAVSWSAIGRVSADAAGRVLGRRVGTQLQSNFLPGQLFVEIESWSRKEIQGFATGIIEELDEQLEAIQKTLTQYGSVIVGIPGLQLSITNLNQKLNAEIDARTQEDAAIRQEILNFNGVSQASLDIQLLAITNAQNTINVQLAEAAQAAHTRANQAWDLANSIPIVNLDPLNTAVSLILARLAILENRKGILPMVDGSVPPNLVYLDDGSLVYVEV